ncbi:MAG TPA: hypothetical protein VHK27_12120 [Gammaproteobacteria bacterium]|nr:hypothetical protein [Gammaproteobacteria bacterium]
MPNSRGLGGSGTRWNIPSGIGERLRALEPVDFESRNWLPRSGWPSDYAELKPYYACAAALCGIEPEQSSSEECARRDGHRPLPLHPDTVETTIFHSARQRLVGSGDGELASSDRGKSAGAWYSVTQI